MCTLGLQIVDVGCAWEPNAPMDVPIMFALVQCTWNGNGDEYSERMSGCYDAFE